MHIIAVSEQYEIIGGGGKGLFEVHHRCEGRGRAGRWLSSAGSVRAVVGRMLQYPHHL